MTPYSNMTIWALEQERDKIVTELATRYAVRDKRPSEAVERWILVSERLPEPHEFVLIYQPDAGSQHRVAYHDAIWRWPYSFNYEHPCAPTHWMPLPSAPEGKE